MSTILALDLGTKTGYAVSKDGRLVQSGTRVDKPGRYDGGGMRYLRFRHWLTDMHRLTVFERIYFEEVRRHVSTDSAHVYGGFLAHLTAWCEENRVPYEGLPVGTIKKSAAGKGNASKQEILVAMNTRWQLALDTGAKTKDDNEGDALAILHTALTQEPKAPRRTFSA